MPDSNLMPARTDLRLATAEPVLNRLLSRLRVGRSPAVRADILLRATLHTDHAGLLSLMLTLLNDERFAAVAAFVLESDGSKGRARVKYLPHLAAVYNVTHIDSYEQLRAQWFLKHGIHFDELVLN